MGGNAIYKNEKKPNCKLFMGMWVSRLGRFQSVLDTLNL